MHRFGVFPWLYLVGVLDLHMHFYDVAVFSLRLRRAAAFSPVGLLRRIFRGDAHVR